jgi:N utilization substance protein B
VASRRRAREIALQVLFEAEVGRQPLADTLGRAREFAPDEDWVFITALCEGTWAAREELDARLAAVTSGWSPERLAGTDRAILRLAAFELLHLGTPAPVVINEAIELAKAYSTEDSGRFVNGVLGALVRPGAGQASVHDR